MKSTLNPIAKITRNRGGYKSALHLEKNHSLLIQFADSKIIKSCSDNPIYIVKIDVSLVGQMAFATWAI